MSDLLNLQLGRQITVPLGGKTQCTEESMSIVSERQIRADIKLSVLGASTYQNHSEMGGSCVKVGAVQFKLDHRKDTAA